MLDIADAMQRAWGYTAPRSYIEMQRAGLFDVSKLPRSQWAPAILDWIEKGEPPRVWLVVFEVASPDVVAQGNAFVKETLVEGLIPIGADSSGDAWCFDTRTKIGGTTPVMHVPHDGGGGVYVAPSFAAFVLYLILENLGYLHFYERWKLTRDDLVATSRRSLEAAAPWLLARWRRRAEEALAAKTWWPDHRALRSFLATEPAFARLPRGEHDVFR